MRNTLTIPKTEKLEKLFAEKQRAAKKIQKEEKELQRLREKARTEGRADRRILLKEEIRKKETLLRSLADPVSEDDIRDAWEEFSSGYNKGLQDRLGSLEAARRSLCGLYRALCEYQNYALKMRERCRELIRTDPFEMDCIPSAGYSAEADYLNTLGMISSEQFADWQKIINDRTPVR